MYKYTAGKVIIRLSDNAFIPMDTANTDYQTYLAWKKQGNIPQPADPIPDPTPPPTAQADALKKAKKDLEANPDLPQAVKTALATALDTILSGIQPQ